MKIVTTNLKREINASKDVCLWNHRDHEHLTMIHKGYHKTNLIYENNTVAFFEEYVTLPGLSFLPIKTIVFLTNTNNPDGSTTVSTYGKQLGIWSLSEATYLEKEEDKTEIELSYTFYLTGIFKFIPGFFRYMSKRHNKRAFEEDIPLKLRRQKVKELNFKDFGGSEIDSNFKLPLKKLKISPVLQHPIFLKKK